MPKPPRTTVFDVVDGVQANPSRGAKLFKSCGTFTAFACANIVSVSQRMPRVSVSRSSTRHISCANAEYNWLFRGSYQSPTVCVYWNGYVAALFGSNGTSVRNVNVPSLLFRKYVSWKSSWTSPPVLNSWRPTAYDSVSTNW